MSDLLILIGQSTQAELTQRIKGIPATMSDPERMLLEMMYGDMLHIIKQQILDIRNQP